MESSLVIFLIWLCIAVVGVATKINKQNKERRNNPAPAPHKMTLDEIIEKLQQPAPKTAAPEVKAQKAKAKERTKNNIKTEPFKEGERSTAAPKSEAVAAETAQKGPDMDFDPIEMVVYSEIMQPGYEKY